MKNRKYRNGAKSLQLILLEAEYEKWCANQAAQAAIDREIADEQRRQDRKAYIGAAFMCLATGVVIIAITLIASQLNL